MAVMAEIGVLGKDETGLIFRYDIADIFLKLLATIPESTRNIFLSSRFENLTYSEIADKYGITPRKVKREIQHVLEIMRTSLKDYLPLIVLLSLLMSGNSTTACPPSADIEISRVSDEVTSL